MEYTCIFCMYGIHLEKGENRFQRLEKTHPQLHDYCMNKLGFKEVCEFMNIPYSNDISEKESVREDTKHLQNKNELENSK